MLFVSFSVKNNTLSSGIVKESLLYNSDNRAAKLPFELPPMTTLLNLFLSYFAQFYSQLRIIICVTLFSSCNSWYSRSFNNALVITFTNCEPLKNVNSFFKPLTEVTWSILNLDRKPWTILMCNSLTSDYSQKYSICL